MKGTPGRGGRPPPRKLAWKNGAVSDEMEGRRGFGSLHVALKTFSERVKPDQWHSWCDSDTERKKRKQDWNAGRRETIKPSHAVVAFADVAG